MLSMPLLVYQLFRFVAPGLMRNEKRWVLMSLPAITLSFVAGVLFCYFLVLPSALNFLLNFGRENVKNTPTITQFLDFVTHFLLAVGKVFLLDAAVLTGLYRVASFFGLGVSLMVIGYVYQRVVFHPVAGPAAAVSPPPTRS